MSTPQVGYTVSLTGSLEQEVLICTIFDIIAYIQWDATRRLQQAPEGTFVNLSYTVKRLALFETGEGRLEDLKLLSPVTKTVWLQNIQSLLEPW